MDVTKDNFSVSFACVEETINYWADFCSIDLELSGVESCASKNHYLDTINERYKRILAHAPEFIIIQFGICAFRLDPITNSYLARPFNFNLFPHTFRSIDKRFVCQASSLQFLAKNKFDFNKFVYQGIPYLSKSQEDILRKRGPPVPQSHATVLPLNESDVTFLATIWEVLDNWQHEGTTETSISLPISSAFQRKLLYQEVPKRYPNYVIETVDAIGCKHLRISVADKSSAKERMDQDLEQNIGFRRVIDVLTSARKPIIGHNIFLDLIHLYSQFYAPLPDSSEAFKVKIAQLFPTLIDTKLMASKVPSLQTTNLELLYNHLSKAPFDRPIIELDAGYQSYILQNKFHEAGFDAYAAGTVYLRLQLGSASRIVNLIPIPRSDSLFNLEGIDVVPDRSRVFHVYGLPDFPRHLQEERLIKHFCRFGSVSITWIDEVSAFISIDPPNHYMDVPTREEICRDRLYKVSTYDAFHGANEKKLHLQQRAGGISVSMIDSRVTLDELQEIQIHNSYEELAEYRDQRFDNMSGLRLCNLL